MAVATKIFLESIQQCLGITPVSLLTPAALIF
jgi:hypothetical protein